MLNLLRFIPRLLFPQGYPAQFVFFITSKCNLRCQHCFYHERLNNSDRELSLLEIDRISRRIKYLLWLSLTGGEPFLRDDIVEIVRLFYRNTGFYLLTITTNGMLTENIVQSVHDICVASPKSRVLISVSIDGLEDTHDLLRNAKGSFRKAVATVVELKKLRNKCHNLNVSTVTTINSINQKEMKSLALFIKDDLRPDSMSINLIRGAVGDRMTHGVKLEHYLDFINIERIGWQSGDFAYYDIFAKNIIQKRELRQKEIITRLLREKRCVVPCLAGHISGVLRENGDVYACEMLDKKIGNIREGNYDFSKIWFSRKANEIRSYIKDTKCFCTYECAITSNILFNVKELINLNRCRLQANLMHDITPDL
ncbi:MAG: radical SAM protein [Candidatus Omnitrophica bacterium]|nr:radical SAM protein [Candidatus Omnitrophota bacterium]